MPEQFKVISTPEQKKQVGELIVWRLNLQRGQNGDTENVTAETLRLPNFPPPSEGTTFEGELEQNPPYGWKLKLPDGIGGKGRGSGAGRGRTSPDERRSIERQTSVKVAAASLFTIDRNASKEDVADWGKKLRWLTDEVHAAIRGESEKNIIS